MEKNAVLSYVDDYVYWYTSEAPGKWFVGNLGKRFHVKYLVYAHCFMSTRIYQMRDYYISVDQDINATSIVAKYFDTATVKISTKCYRNTFHMIGSFPNLMQIPVMSKLRS